MKQIQSFSVWFNGQSVQAQILDAYVINDNLNDSATFWWGIYTEGIDPQSRGICVSAGNLTMAGQDYINWNANPDINNAAYQWIAEQLGLTII